MKKNTLIKILLLFFFFVLLMSINCYANDKKELLQEFNDIETIVSETVETVYDYADILSEKEENQLRELSDTYKLYPFSMIFLTIDNTQNKSTINYVNEFYESNSFLSDGIVYVINTGNSEIHISKFGYCIDMLSDDIITSTLDEIFHYATNKQYYECLNSMESLTIKYITSNYTQNKQLPYIPTKENVMISVIITIGAIIFLIFNHNKANKKPKAQIYMKNNFNILNKTVIFLGDKREIIRDYYKQNDTNNRRSNDYFPINRRGF